MIVLINIGFFAVIGWMMWMIARYWQKRTEAQAEFRRQMLDKFANGEEFIVFARTPEGQRLLHAKAPAGSDSSRLVLWAVRLGTGLTVTGLGALTLGFILYRTGTDDACYLVVISALVTILGVGFLASAYVSHRLARTLKADATNMEAAPAPRA